MPEVFLRRRRVEYGGENRNIAIVEEAARRLEAEGYGTSLHKEYREREGITSGRYVELVLRARKEFPSSQGTPEEQRRMQEQPMIPPEAPVSQHGRD
jgi:hypothetical protein